MNKIQFTVGDWSGDGHDETENFFVFSSLSVEELREVHFLAESVLGFDIGAICADYDEHDLEESIRNRLVEIGILIEGDGVKTEDLDPDDVMEIWVRILCYVAQEKGIPLTLNRVSETEPSPLPLDALRVLLKNATENGLKAEITLKGEDVADPVATLFTALSDAAKSKGGRLSICVTGHIAAPVPTIHFFGFDQKKRHLKTPGYGVFYF